jgi:hypothetical protein
MRFLQGEAFTLSLRDLYQKGGKYQKAAQTVQGIWGRAKLDGTNFDEVFQGVARTNYGENRVPHCVKYDLTGFARLVTVVNNGVCLFLYAGDHDTVDAWLDSNKGLDFVAKQQGETLVLDKVRVSVPALGPAGRITGESDLSVGPLIKLLPDRYVERILHGLELDVRAEVEKVESISDDDLVFSVCTMCAPAQRQDALMDVLISLRAGDITNAKSRIDLYADAAKPVEKLPTMDVMSLKSSDAAVLLSDVDPELFQHFVQTASFEKWMLYLHPSQRQHVDRDFKGSARMAGVSGSGKTCVLVHRALRLADLYSPEPVLILTLSQALATLINRLVDAQRGPLRPRNLRVTSIFDLCFDKLMQLEPHRRDYYTKRSIAKNPHAIPEHVDDVWQEYFLCQNNNRDADAVMEVVQSLNSRGIYANDYLRQEFDFVRSRFAPNERDGYLQMEREGRIVPFDERFRKMTLEGLAGWERKMDAVGVIDDLGIVAALHRHLQTLQAEYRAVLVDEAQDLGTLELSIIRRLTYVGDNDFFLCGDAAQTIYTKSTDLKAAGIDTAGRSLRLNQNYRNSRQILTAANQVLTRALETMPKGAMNLEVLEPEFASFSSPKPLLLEAASFLEELERGLGFLRTCAEDGPQNQRYCLAICGFSQASIEHLGTELSLPILAANCDVGSGRIFLSDLEQTKGFEFDTVVVINCSVGVLPHPNLPPEESFRDLCRLYVAMTRAKTQLVVSYSSAVSPFVEAAKETFVQAAFADYAECFSIEGCALPEASIPKLLDSEAWGRPGTGFLKSRDAVGLDRVLQEEILNHVGGVERLRGRERKQLEWKTFGSFAKAMENPRARHQVISEEAWSSLVRHLSMLRGDG